MTDAFQDWLRGAMDRRRVNQSALALYVGVKPSAVSRWLREVAPSKPSPLAARRLEEFFKTEPGYVLRLLDYMADDVEEADVPLVIRELALQMDPAELEAWERSGRVLLELRELKARYGDQE